jgi:hypothetical protein
VSHSGWPLKTDGLGNPLEIVAMTTKAIIYRMAQLVYQGV